MLTHRPQLRLQFGTRFADLAQILLELSPAVQGLLEAGLDVALFSLKALLCFQRFCKLFLDQFKRFNCLHWRISILWDFEFQSSNAL